MASATCLRSSAVKVRASTPNSSASRVVIQPLQISPSVVLTGPAFQATMSDRSADQAASAVVMDRSGHPKRPRAAADSAVRLRFAEASEQAQRAGLSSPTTV
jgi:hypothetical protein